MIKVMDDYEPSADSMNSYGPFNKINADLNEVDQGKNKVVVEQSERVVSLEGRKISTPNGRNTRVASYMAATKSSTKQKS